MGQFVDVVINEAMTNTLRGGGRKPPVASKLHLTGQRLADKCYVPYVESHRSLTDQPNRVVALTTSVTLEPNDSRRLASLCGPFDQNLKFIERRMGVRIRNRGNEFQLSGPAQRVEAG